MTALPAPTPKPGYQPTADELMMTPRDGMSGGVSHFANPDDESTRGRKMGISGEPADAPWDQWYCAMRFAYTRVQIDPKNQWWVKPISGTSDLPRKQALRDSRLMVTNPATGTRIVVRPADWGPGAWAVPGGPKYRVIDLSASALDALGLGTDGYAEVAWCDPSTPLGPVK